MAAHCACVQVAKFGRQSPQAWHVHHAESRDLASWRVTSRDGPLAGDLTCPNTPHLGLHTATMAPGERSEEVWLWYTAVYEAIQEIPYGKVTSYGHIARLVGKPECPRQVGVCLKNLPSPSPSGDSSRTKPRFHSGNVPWQRVINAKGGISPRSAPSSWRQGLVAFLCICLLTKHKEDQVRRRTKQMLCGERV